MKSVAVQSKSQNKSSKKKVGKRRISRRRTNQSIPAAYITRRKAGRTFMRMSAGDTTLGVSETFPIYSTGDGCSFLLPICPTKWSNTRAASLTAAFSSHRPLSLTYQWDPAVGTSTPGSIAIGTIFAGNRLPVADDSWSSVSRALNCTNGGTIFSIWAKTNRRVMLGRNLTQNQYPLYEVSADDIPFWIAVATSVDKGTLIGYLTVNAVFTLRNPTAGQMSPPTTASGDLTFTHDEEKKTTTLKTPKSMWNKALSLGQDYLLTAGKSLVNTLGSKVVGILSPFIASLTSDDGDSYTFNVDSNLATQSALGYCIGLASNF